jgi:general secretion pathway protein H
VPGRPDERGFTLIELMIVLALIGLAASVVVLTMAPPGGNARDDAIRLAARVAALRDRAIIEGRTHGLWVSPSGYGFERRIRTDEGPQWQPLTDGRLSRDDWREGTAASIGGAATGRVSFDRVGLPDRSATIIIARSGTEASVVIDGAGDVSVR